MAVHIDAAAVYIVEPHEQVDDGGLARAGGPHDGNGLPRCCLQVQVLQDNGPRHIAEGYVSHLHMALHLGQHLGIFRIRQFLLGVQQSKRPLRSGQGGENFIGDVGNLVDGAGELPRVEHKAGNIAQAYPSPGIQQGSHQADQG